MKTMKMSKQDTFCRIEIFSVDENENQQNKTLIKILNQEPWHGDCDNDEIPPKYRIVSPAMTDGSGIRSLSLQSIISPIQPILI